MMNGYIFTTCQVGAEQPLRSTFSTQFPMATFAFSRPGFVTWKVPEATVQFASEVSCASVFVRSCGVSLGKVPSTDMDVDTKRDTDIASDTLCSDICGIAQQHLPLHEYKQIHVWGRDKRKVGDSGYEPAVSPELQRLQEKLAGRVGEKFPTTGHYDGVPFQSSFPAAMKISVPTHFSSNTVLDVIQVEPSEYWVGYHTAISQWDEFPGGLLPLEPPSNMVSRAWLKFESAIQLAGFDIRPKDTCLDIGCAPGGSSQTLLSRGCTVLGVDPAEVSPVILSQPKFRHLRGRVGQLRRSLFRKATWGFCDMNVAPTFTLQVLEELVSRADSRLRGIIFTLKLPDYSLAANIPQYMERIESWGVRILFAKQLPYNRQEITVAVCRS